MGRRPPGDNIKRELISAKIDADLFQWVREKAAKERRPIYSILEEALKEFKKSQEDSGSGKG